jgi:hypothetical protein
MGIAFFIVTQGLLQYSKLCPMPHAPCPMLFLTWDTEFAELVEIVKSFHKIERTRLDV